MKVSGATSNSQSSLNDNDPLSFASAPPFSSSYDTVPQVEVETIPRMPESRLDRRRLAQQTAECPLAYARFIRKRISHLVTVGCGGRGGGRQAEREGTTPACRIPRYPRVAPACRETPLIAQLALKPRRSFVKRTYAQYPYRQGMRSRVRGPCGVNNNSETSEDRCKAGGL